MLGFILTLESLALSLGCNRSQLLIGVKQASQEAEDPAKLGLLWTTEWLLNLRSLEQMRDFFDQVLTNPLRISALPDYLNGFILALTFAPRMSRFVVELLSQLFASVPDPVLLPWLPNLILKLRPHAQLLPTLIQEAASNFPNSLAEFDHWQPHWSIATDATASPASLPTAQTLPLSESDQQIRRLLFEHPETAEQLARLLGIESITWNLEAPESAGEPATSTEQPLSERELRIQELLQMYPVPTATLAALLKN
jgi:hypothetical protein